MPRYFYRRNGRLIIHEEAEEEPMDTDSSDSDVVQVERHLRGGVQVLNGHARDPLHVNQRQRERGNELEALNQNAPAFVPAQPAPNRPPSPPVEFIGPDQAGENHQAVVAAHGGGPEAVGVAENLFQRGPPVIRRVSQRNQANQAQNPARPPDLDRVLRLLHNISSQAQDLSAENSRQIVTLTNRVENFVSRLWNHQAMTHRQILDMGERIEQLLQSLQRIIQNWRV